MEQVLLVIQVILAVGLIGMVLIQRSESDGFGLGGGGGGGVISGRAQANLMTRTTAIFAALFIINSLALSILASHNRAPTSIADTIEQQQKSTMPTVPTDADVKSDKKMATPVDEKKADMKKGNAPAVPTDADDAPAMPKDEAPVSKPAAKKVIKKAAPNFENTDESSEPADTNE